MSPTKKKKSSTSRKKVAKKTPAKKVKKSVTVKKKTAAKKAQPSKKTKASPKKKRPSLKPNTPSKHKTTTKESNKALPQKALITTAITSIPSEKTPTATSTLVKDMSTLQTPRSEENNLSPFVDDFDTSRKELEEGYPPEEDQEDSVDDDLYANDETEAFDDSGDNFDHAEEGDANDYESMMALSDQPFLDDSSLFDDDE